MANAMRGEASFEVAGKKLTLLFDANAFCDIEDALSTPDNQVGMSEILEALQKGMNMKTFRAIFHGGLLAHHPEMTLRQAGAVISDLGFDEAAKHLGDAIRKAMPEKKKGGASKGN